MTHMIPIKKLPADILSAEELEFYRSLGPATGFQPTRPILPEDSLRLHKMARDIYAWHTAVESGAIETMKTSIRNDQKKRLKDTELVLTYALVAEHGVDELTWPDGLCAEIVQPLNNSRGTLPPTIRVFRA
jgi:hypothetical protein